MLPRPACLPAYVILWALFAFSSSASIASNWTNPDARQPDFSSNYLVGERIYLSWQPLNDSLNDLWLVRPDDASDNYSLRIASSLNISKADAFPWIISLPEDQVLKDTRFAFVFTLPGSNYDPENESELQSRSFNLMIVNQANPPNGTVAATTSSARPTSTSSPADSSSGTSSPSTPSAIPSEGGLALGPKEIVGIAVGVVALVGFAGFLIGYMAFKKRWPQHNRKSSAKSEDSILTAAEAPGSSQYPVEAAGKESQVHEMAISKETLVYESDSTSVFEMGNTVKRPGLHEMPG